MKNMDRRRFLEVAATAPLALSALALSGSVEAQERTARSALITVFLSGGIDAKSFTNPDQPSSPEELRGPLRSIPTMTPGIRFSEVWPEMASKQDKFATLRAIDASTSDHVIGAQHIALRGTRTLAEGIGERAAQGGVPYVFLNPGSDWPAVDSAFQRSMAFSPLYENGRFLPPEMSSTANLNERRALLESFDTTPIHSPVSGRMMRFRQTAFDLLQGSGRFFDALNLPERDRERYGRNLTGDMILTAKRFVEAGAGAVTVYHELDGGAWDMHSGLEAKTRELAPPMDHALATLIEEIASHRLNAVLLVTSEFNRTPRVNRSAGRDHWPYGAQAILAGGRVRGGAVHGRTNNQGQMLDGIVRQREELANTTLVACGEEIPPAAIRSREIL